MERTLAQLAEEVGGTVAGDGSVVITGVAGLDEAGPGDITFLANPKYAKKVATTRAGGIIVTPGTDTGGRPAIEAKNPYLCFARIVTLFHVRKREPVGVMPGAYVAPTARVGSDCSLYPGSFVGEGAVVGDRTVLHPGVTVYEEAVVGDDVVLHSGVAIRERCRVGNRVIIHNGTVVGSDGFGYAFDGKGHYKIPQVGAVTIGDDVEIGANCTVDRGALEDTRIGAGTKIDNLVQIAHNCILGEHCIIVAQGGVSGSTRLGDYVTLGGQVGVAGHIQIGSRTMVGAKSGVHNNVGPGQVVSGVPAIPHQEWLKAAMSFGKLPEMRKSVTDLEKRLRRLEARLAEE